MIGSKNLACLFLFEGYLLAHLWGAYAIPVALSGVRRSWHVVCHVLSVSTITTRNN